MARVSPNHAGTESQSPWINNLTTATLHSIRSHKAVLSVPSDFQTTTNGRAGRLLVTPGSLIGHPSKQQLRSTLLDSVILR
ncbi:hypothetical protein J6590_075054 [Homalodisca vitripennis]|nr:hypothetical protein J6590_075054 [Homalodisca vitripennis]